MIGDYYDDESDYFDDHFPDEPPSYVDEESGTEYHTTCPGCGEVMESLYNFGSTRLCRGCVQQELNRKEDDDD